MKVRPNERRHPMDLYALRDRLRGGPLESRQDDLDAAVGLWNAVKLMVGGALLGGAIVGGVLWLAVNF